MDLFGMTPEQINAISGRNLEGSQLGVNTIGKIADMMQNRETAEINRENTKVTREKNANELLLNIYKAQAEAAAKAANAAKDDAERVLKQKEADNFGQKVRETESKIKENEAQAMAARASAGASSRANMGQQVGLNPKSGKYEWFSTATGKFTGVEAAPKEIDRGGSDKPSDASVKLQSATEDLMYDANKKPAKSVNKARMKALNDYGKTIGKEVKVVKLKKVEIPGKLYDSTLDEVEVPVIIDSDGKIDPNDIVDALIRVHGYSKEDAIAHVKSLQKR